MGVWGLHDDLLKRRWWLVPSLGCLCLRRLAEQPRLEPGSLARRGYRVAGGRLIPVVAQEKQA